MVKYSRFSGLFLLIGMALITACQPQQAQVVEVPTLMALPTETETWTPSHTFTPSDTYTPTHTFTPTDTPTHTPTFTSTHTATPPPTVPSPTFTWSYTFTWTPSITPRPTLTPSNTPEPPTLTPSPVPSNTRIPSRTPLPPPTLTPSPFPSPTVPQPQITSFVTSANQIASNGTLLVSWTAIAETARLDVLSQSNAVLQSYPVPVAGSYSIVPGPGAGTLIYVRLTVFRSGAQTSQTLPIAVLCAQPWFFGNQYAPPGTGCPADLGATYNGSFQAFERGFMLYVTANGINRIYGAVNTGAYVGVASGWDGSPGSSTPPGCSIAVEGVINWAYNSSFGPNAQSWNQALGCPTGGIASGTFTIQYENAVGGSNPFFANTPDTAVYRFSGGDFGTYTRIR